ncbi:MAG: 3'-5' exonuclease [Acidimicrobiales bacterium]
MWEAALIMPELGGVPRGTGRPVWERVWQLPVDLRRADDAALEVGGFASRRLPEAGLTRPGAFATEFARLTAGRWLAGTSPSFDAGFLRALLEANGARPRWGFHLVDVVAMAAGRCGRPPPWSSHALSRAVGVDPDDYHRHSALGDARWARAVYDAVLATAVPG